jgi:hypothetical protein
MRKKFFALLLTAAMVVTAGQAAPITAKAETNGNGYQTAETLDGTVSDTLDKYYSRWYKYTMPSTDGHVHFELNSADPETEFILTVYDPKVQQIVRCYESNSVTTREFAFDPGTTIYLKVYSYQYQSNMYSNGYSLESNFTAASDWENDYTNDELSGADTLYTDTACYGDVITDYDVDWYKYQLPSDGNVSFTLENTNSVSGAQWYIDVYNSAKQQIISTDNDSSDYSITTDSVHESAGKTVYVKIYHWNSYTSGYTYQLTPHFTPDKKSDSDNNTSGSDSDSSSDSGNTVPVPDKVTGIKVSNVKGPKVKISFSDQDDAEGYQISYTYSGVTRTKTISSTSAKVYVPKGKTVSVKVRAYNHNDSDQKQYGEWSSVKTKKTDRK